MLPKVSLQTFTIRRFLKSPTAIEGAFAKLEQLGISAIELAYTKLIPSHIEAVAAASKKHAIDVGSSQITYDFLDKQRDWVLKFHLEQLSCENTSVSVLPGALIRADEQALLRFCEKLDGLGEYYRKRGLNLAFHHHDYEFRRYGQQTGLDLIMNNTGNDNVGLVIDTYWTQRGGKTPQQQIIDYAGRVKVIHLRDYSVQNKWFDMSPYDVELGQGNLDIEQIVESCKSSGVHYMAIEQSCKTPFDSIKTSAAYLHQLGYQGLF